MSARLRKTATLDRALQASAPLFAALGDETRLSIVSRLGAAGPTSIATLTEGTGVTRQAVTKHLHVLAQAGLVRSARAGRERVWELEPHRLLLARRFIERIALLWDERLERLKKRVENAQ
jgi:DNA-binding transcriptional ArsR family regulator